MISHLVGGIDGVKREHVNLRCGLSAHQLERHPMLRELGRRGWKHRATTTTATTTTTTTRPLTTTGPGSYAGNSTYSG